MIWQDNHDVFFLYEDRGSLRSILIRQWISRQIWINFKTSVIWHSWFWEVNTSAIELIMIAYNLGKGSNSPLNEVLYCRCLITNNNEHSISQESDHITMQSRLVISNTSGTVPWDDMYHEKFNPIKRGPSDNPEYPRHHIKVQVLPITFIKRCHTLELFCQTNQGWRNKISHSKGSKFWTLADR